MIKLTSFIQSFCFILTLNITFICASMAFPGVTQAYFKAGPATIFNSEFIEVDVRKSYTLEGDFRSLGQGSSTLYFGVSCYDTNKNIITDYHIYRCGEPAVVTQLGQQQIIVGGVLSGWNEPTAVAPSRSIGFYFGGDLNKLPTIYYTHSSNSQDPTHGTYNSAEGNTITLNTPLPHNITQQIIIGTTKIMNHYPGGTFLYSAAAGVPVPHEFTHYSAHISGECWGYDKNTFRQSTKYIKILILANYAQDQTYELMFKNIRFSTYLFDA